MSVYLHSVLSHDLANHPVLFIGERDVLDGDLHVGHVDLLRLLGPELRLPNLQLLRLVCLRLVLVD